LASLFNTKARLWVRGRKNWRNRISASGLTAEGQKIWVHCASLGEFEQGRPLIEKIKSRSPETLVILSFFSPSGYEIRKNYDKADLVLYLPLDTPANSRDFIQLIKPDLAVFVKYEFWYFFLEGLHREKIPTILVSALFRPEQAFFQAYGRFFQKMLFFFTHIFVQNKVSAEQLDKIALKHYSVAGDTRVDRVLGLARESRTFPLVENFVRDAPVLIAGSTWPPDEDRLLPFLKNDCPPHWKAIIAPHEIDEAHIEKIERGLDKNYIRYSRLSEATKAQEYRFLIIDNIGMLASLYRYGKMAYIGGGFGKGIHNTLEPITFGLPVIFGPKYGKFEEAVSLINNGGAYTVNSREELSHTFQQLADPAFYRKASKKARGYIDQNQGATDIVLSSIEKEKWINFNNFDAH